MNLGRTRDIPNCMRPTKGASVRPSPYSTEHFGKMYERPPLEEVNQQRCSPAKQDGRPPAAHTPLPFDPRPQQMRVNSPSEIPPNQQRMVLNPPHMPPPQRYVPNPWQRFVVYPQQVSPRPTQFIPMMSPMGPGPQQFMNPPQMPQNAPQVLANPQQVPWNPVTTPNSMPPYGPTPPPNPQPNPPPNPAPFVPYQPNAQRFASNQHQMISNPPRVVSQTPMPANSNRALVNPRLGVSNVQRAATNSQLFRSNSNQFLPNQGPSNIQRPPTNMQPNPTNSHPGTFSNPLKVPHFLPESRQISPNRQHGGINPSMGSKPYCPATNQAQMVPKQQRATGINLQHVPSNPQRFMPQPQSNLDRAMAGSVSMNQRRIAPTLGQAIPKMQQTIPNLRQAMSSTAERNDVNLQQNSPNLQCAMANLQPIPLDPRQVGPNAPQISQNQSEIASNAQLFAPNLSPYIWTPVQIKEEPLDFTETLSPPSTEDDFFRNGTSERDEYVNRILNNIKPVSSPLILNELYNDAFYDYANVGDEFIATLEVDGKLYIGHGSWKEAAEAAAANDAIKELVMSGIDEQTGDEVLLIPISLLFSHALFKMADCWKPGGMLVARLQSGLQPMPYDQASSGDNHLLDVEQMHPMVVLAHDYPAASFSEVSFPELPDIFSIAQGNAEDEIFTNAGNN